MGSLPVLIHMIPDVQSPVDHFLDVMGLNGVHRKGSPEFCGGVQSQPLEIPLMQAQVRAVRLAGENDDGQNVEEQLFSWYSRYTFTNSSNRPEGISA